MKLDQGLLERFEAGLNPHRIEASTVPARLIGYGEISAIFLIAGHPEVAFKRMPLFDTAERAATYAGLYREYGRLLTRAGLNLPDSATAVVDLPGRPVVLYIGQRAFAADRIGNRLLHALTPAQNKRLIRRIMTCQAAVWDFNRTVMPDLEVAVDGQISNWVLEGDLDTGAVYYLDTSTPFIRRQGRHQLDAELLLQAAPRPLRWILRRFFVSDVLDRYYDPRQNLIDMVANLYKEQCPDLIPMAIDTVNAFLPAATAGITRDEVDNYYKEDRFIWSLFLNLRRLDRFTTTRILHRRYEFILPGRIQR